MADGLELRETLNVLIIITPQIMTQALKMVTLISTTMSDLSSLQNKSSEIEHSLDTWNGIYIVGLVIALLAGALTLAATHKVFSQSRKLRIVNADISRLKDIEVDTARRETAQLYRKLGPRYITKEEQARFIKATKDGPKPPAIWVAMDAPSDPESRDFARDIFRALTAAGYNCKLLAEEKDFPVARPSAGDNPYPGIRMDVEAQHLTKPWVRTLETALDSIGVKLWLTGPTRQSARPPNEGGIIVIGEQPKPSFDPATH